MTLSITDKPVPERLTASVDHIYVLNHRAEFEMLSIKTSYASVETDGTYTSQIDADSRLMLITNISRAEYFAYLDENDKIVLYMYSQISPIKEKEIDDGIKRLWSHVANLIQQSDEEVVIEEPKPEATITSEQLTHDEAVKKMLLYNEGLVDLNHMHCDVCGSDNFFEFVTCDDGKTIEAQCSKCYAIYRLIPSKYYMIHSRTIFMDNSKNQIDPTLLQNQKGKTENAEPATIGNQD